MYSGIHKLNLYEEKSVTKHNTQLQLCTSVYMYRLLVLFEQKNQTAAQAQCRVRVDE